MPGASHFLRGPGAPAGGQDPAAEGCGKLLYSAVRRGGVPEWLKGADCKSVGLRLRWFESSLLHQGESVLMVEAERTCEVAGACPLSRVKTGSVPGPGGCSSMVELKPSKLKTRVRFPSPAPASVVESNVATGLRQQELTQARVDAHVAQW